MFKLVELMKRNPALTVEEFRSRYEVFADALVPFMPGVKRYVRRYFDPLPGAEPVEDWEFDCIAELWFSSIDDVAVSMELYNSPECTARLDEPDIFDMTKSRYFTVLERESQV